MSSLDVAIVVTQSEAAGAQTLAIQIAREFRCLGVSTEVWFLYRKGTAFATETNLWTALDRPPSSLRDYIDIYACLIRRLRHLKPAVIMSFGHYTNVTVLPIAWLTGTPIRVAGQHQVRTRIPCNARILDAIIGSTPIYSRNIAVSQSILDGFGTLSQAYRKRSTVICNGVEVRRTRLTKAQARAKLGLPEGKLLAIAVGRLTHQKGFDLLIEALATPAVSELHLAIAGDGEDRAKLTERVNALSLNGRVIFCGSVAMEDMPDFYGCADFFVMSSRWEAFGLVTVEAALSGLPIVASRIPACEEILLDDGEAPCLFFDLDEPNSLISALSTMISDSEVSGRLAAMSSKIGERYEIKAVARKYLQLLSDCDHRHRSPGLARVAELERGQGLLRRSAAARIVSGQIASQGYTGPRLTRNCNLEENRG